MLYRLYATLEFNREVDADKDFISPGGFHFITHAGKELDFDFENYMGNINKSNPKEVFIEMRNPDIYSFENIPDYTLDDFLTIVSCSDFYVDLEGCEEDINLTKISNVVIEFNDTEQDKIKDIALPDDMFTLLIEMEQDIDR